MLSLLKGKARQAVLDAAKRQMYRNTVEFREDTRPVHSIKNLYRELNKELFDNQLPENLEVKMNGKLRKCLGKAYYIYSPEGKLIPTRIEIKKNHRWTSRFIRKVMTHEMCHVWAYKFHNEEKHGPKFWRKMKELGYPKTHCWDDAMSCEKDIYS